jgi:hypothetical protein
LVPWFCARADEAARTPGGARREEMRSLPSPPWRRVAAAPGKYVKQETLDEQFGAVLRQLTFANDIIDLITSTLRESHRTQTQYHEAAVKRLEESRAVVQRRIDRLYLEKLDGNIDADTFEHLSGEMRLEQSRTPIEIEQHQLLQ